MVVKVRDLDLFGTNMDSVRQFDLIRIALKKDGLYEQDLLYRGFDGKNINRLLNTGQDTNDKSIFCATEEQIINEFPVDGFDFNPFDYAFDYKKPALAVFNARHFLNGDTISEYYFKDPNRKPEALVAIYRLISG